MGDFHERITLFKVVILVCFQIFGESDASNDGARATTTSEPEDDGDGDTSTMDPEPVVVHRGSQCNIRFPSFIR